ncbi:type IV secretory system conjugative DNA transfer family protein [Parasutterella muris]|uniref:type IV secretory system conjugative DNA transfer family protein n=1 Tax=Parasutterella muris TaxID=2565572 RepID=UPI00203A56D7|nr:type IV secretory system conjugative DNA transfer family protein [Parasutterella muris]
MKSQRAAKIAFIVLAGCLTITMLYMLASFILMRIFNLPIEQCRPWTIIQYWMTYRGSSSKFIRIAVNVCFLLPPVLLVSGVIFLIAQRNKRPLHGAARFANDAEVKKAGLIDPPEGLEKTILVGKFKNQYLTYGGFQFVLLAAPTRSGKGVGVVVPNCLNYSDSLVVLDIKGENFDITSGFRKACGQEVFLFSPYAEDGKTHRYNPLDYISTSPAERLGDIDAIGQALYAGEGNNDKFWSENAKDFFCGVCLFVLESPELPNTLGEILRQASGKGKPVKEHLFEKIQQAQEAGRPYSSNCVDALNRVLSNSENTLAGIVATFNTALLSFQNPKVDLATSASDFDLREVRRKRMSVYFKIEPTKLKDARVLINLFFDQLLNLNTRTLPSQDKTLKYQCLVLLDEMTSIGTVSMIKQAVSYMAGYNMRLLTIIQNKSQLEDVYGKAGAITLLSNHALMIMYAPSPATQSDANEYSEMLGFQTVKSKSRSSGKGGGSTSESDQRRALMLPQEIRELGQDNEIVTLENTKPIFCKKIKYYEDPVFTKRANWQVPEIPFRDVDLFVAKLEARIRAATESELSDANISSSIVTGDTSLPDDMKNLPDSAWSQDQIEDYVENLMTRSIPQSISNFDALKNVRSSVGENLGTLERMNSAAQQTAADSETKESAQEPKSESKEQSDDLLSVLEDCGLDEDDEESSDPISDAAEKSETEAQTDADQILINAEITANTVSTVEKNEEGSEKQLNVQRTVEANVNASIEAADWSEETCARFVTSLVEQIKKQLHDSPSSADTTESADTSESPDTTESSEPLGRVDFANIKKIRNSYRRAGKNPLFRPSV